MVGFSCLPTHISCHKTKKDGRQHFQECNAREMHTNSSVLSSDEALEVTPVSATSILELAESIPSNTHTNVEQIISPSSFECCRKFKEQMEISYSGDVKELLWSMSLRKSQSVGSGLFREGTFSCNVDMDDEIDQGLPSNNFEDESFGRLANLYGSSGLQEECGGDDAGDSLLNKNQENAFCNADMDDEIDLGLTSNNLEDGFFGRLANLYGSSGLQEGCGSDDAGANLLNKNQENAFGINIDPLSNGSTFFIADIKQFDDEFCQDGEDRSPYHGVASNHTSVPLTFSKSYSLPSLGIHGSSPVCRLMPHRSRSVENLCTQTIQTGYLDGHSRTSISQYREAAPCPDMPQPSDTIGGRVHSEADLGDGCVISGANKECEEISKNEEDFIIQSRYHIFDNKFNDDCASHNLSVSLNDWREPGIDGSNHVSNQMEETFGEWHDLNSENFNMKRIEEWIRQIDIHESGIVQEVGESSCSIPSKQKDYHLLNGMNASRLSATGSGGVEAAYNYISSLVPASTTAQMANLGLVVIPSLSAFSSLRVLNLSCNAIVKITFGALPRGLHMLNLSRNNISIIEGLRELTRLRVLDLSYNRIVRIGHGLAACSSLKELYLASNKISEVDGLHRLLKLNVLDLRFNKISTAKCLGQLAANYASLQAIYLEGNPAQRNVGEEQLKRYLLSLLPQLVYFNKHIIRSSSTKELSDHSSRSSTSRQFDRGTRSSDHKRSRRGSHTVASQKVTSSSNNSRVGQALGYSAKPSRHRDRHAHLPPAGIKAAHHLPRIGSKLLSGVQPINPMRRSRSEGNL